MMIVSHWMTFHIPSKCQVSLLCESDNALSAVLVFWRSCHIVYMYGVSWIIRWAYKFHIELQVFSQKVFLQCVSLNALSHLINKEYWKLCHMVHRCKLPLLCVSKCLSVGYLYAKCLPAISAGTRCLSSVSHMVLLILTGCSYRCLQNGADMVVFNSYMLWLSLTQTPVLSFSVVRGASEGEWGLVLGHLDYGVA